MRLRLEAAVPIAGNLDRELAELALQRFFALTVAGVAGDVFYRFILTMAQVFGHLGVQGALDECLGELF